MGEVRFAHECLCEFVHDEANIFIKEGRLQYFDPAAVTDTGAVFQSWDTT